MSIYYFTNKNRFKHATDLESISNNQTSQKIIIHLMNGSQLKISHEISTNYKNL
jgi:hypothetical protein